MSEPQFRSTYRLQVRREFPLQEVARLTGYFNALGVSHLYLSPLLESKPGSSHGYDTSDPTRLSRERGGDKGFIQLMKEIKGPSLQGVILDIVPNHVTADESNPFWWDVLKNGPNSPYWKFFDIKARRPGDLRIVLPILGRHRAHALAAGEIKIAKKNGDFVLHYWDRSLPLNPKFAKNIESILEESGKPLSKLPLKFIEKLLSEQHYILEEWRKGSREINYRRFFDINDLAAVRMEEKEVFDWAHSKLKELIQRFPQIHGLRVDHIDGLSEPQAYLERLSQISDYVWVEKILGDGEKLSPFWKTCGTTGYEFSNFSARLFVDLSGLLKLHAHYIRHIDTRWERFHECVYQSKKEVLESHFVAEINRLSDHFAGLAKDQKEFTREDIYEALMELTCSLSVYRTYRPRKGEFDFQWLLKAFMEAEGRGHLRNISALNWLRQLLLSEELDAESYQAVKSWEQLSGPVMAKGLEDTALYRYFPLLSLNVVGGEPDWVGDGAIEFHSANQERLQTEPLTLSATSTHDTKRSEDVRSRLHVLSERPDEWIRKFKSWSKATNAFHLPPYVLYFIFETLIGAWPMSGKINEDFISRMKAYFLKAAREAKSQTSWREPQEAFESSLLHFVEGVLKPGDKKGRELLKSLKEFSEETAYFGALNSLSLVTLKIMSPGIPDIYQGAELWDLSLVDPDNRRPVDYKVRGDLLKKLKKISSPSSLLKRWKSGEIKLWLTWKLLSLRQKFPDLFIHGEYIPLEPTGPFKKHFVTFLRRQEEHWVLVIVPRFLAEKGKVKPVLEVNPKLLTVKIPLPKEAPNTWTNLLTGESLKIGDELIGKETFKGLPVCVLFHEGCS